MILFDWEKISEESNALSEHGLRPRVGLRGDPDGAGEGSGPAAVRVGRAEARVRVPAVCSGERGDAERRRRRRAAGTAPCVALPGAALRLLPRGPAGARSPRGREVPPGRGGGVGGRGPLP